MKFKIHFEFRASLRKFQDLNFWGATAREDEALEEGLTLSQGSCYVFFCGENKGHTTRTCQVKVQKQKEIAEAQQNPPKKVIHTSSNYISVCAKVVDVKCRIG
jgi:hypothetical protein